MKRKMVFLLTSILFLLMYFSAFQLLTVALLDANNFILFMNFLLSVVLWVWDLMLRILRLPECVSRETCF